MKENIIVLTQQVFQAYDREILNDKQVEYLACINLETAEFKDNWSDCSSVVKVDILMQLYDRKLITKESLLKQVFNVEYEMDIFTNHLKNQTLKVKKLDKEAKIPIRKHLTDAGMDIYALNDVTIEPLTMQIVRTGITADFPDNTVALVWPKSRSNFLIGAGVIDASYQGEIFVKVNNTSNEDLKIEKHQGLAQIIIVPVLCQEIEEVGEIHQEKTDRGATGGIVRNFKK